MKTFFSVQIFYILIQIAFFYKTKNMSETYIERVIQTEII